MCNIDENYSKSDEQLLIEMKEKFPRVAQWIKEHHKIDAWMNFFDLIDKGVFPPNTIAYQLWLDVVQYMSCDNIHTMRYKSDIVSFWSCGYKLFKGKFVRFMGGPKSSGQVKTQSYRHQ